MKKTLTVAAAAITLLGATWASTDTADAATHSRTPGCVTKSEYKKVKKGMTQKKVTATFGTAGKREARATSGGYVSEIRSYRTCDRYSAVAIAFEKKPGGVLRLSAKSAVWVD